MPDHEPYGDKETFRIFFLGEELEKALSEFNDREKDILKLRYGLEDGHPHTLKDVARVFNTTRERVRQIEQKALEKLKQKPSSQADATWCFDDDLEDYKNPVEAYLQDISKIPPLSPEQEKELAKRAIAGNHEARDQLITANLSLVVSVAEEYMKLKPELSFLDLIQEGNLGLMKAIETFDPTKRYKFSDYATGWISKTITQAIENQSRPIPFPSHLIEAVREELERTKKQKKEHDKQD